MEKLSKMVKRRRSTEPVQDQPDNTSMDGPSNSTPTARLDIEATNQRLPQPKSATVTGKEEDFEAAEELQAEEEGDAPVEKKKRKRTRTRKKRGKSGAAASTAPDGGTAVGDDVGAAGDGLGEGDGGYTGDKNGDGDKLPAGITDTVYVSSDRRSTIQSSVFFMLSVGNRPYGRLYWINPAPFFSKLSTTAVLYCR